MPKFQGSIFDVDGVLVDSPHEKARRESLRELMESSWRGIRDRTTWSPDAFACRRAWAACRGPRPRHIPVRALTKSSRLIGLDVDPAN